MTQENGFEYEPSMVCAFSEKIQETEEAEPDELTEEEYTKLLRNARIRLEEEGFTVTVSLKEEVANALKALPESQAQIIRMKFGLVDGNLYTKEEIAAVLGKPVEEVSSQLDEALAKLRADYKAETASENSN